LHSRSRSVQWSGKAATVAALTGTDALLATFADHCQCPHRVSFGTAGEGRADERSDWPTEGRRASRRARGAQLPSFGLILIGKRPGAALIQCLAQPRRQLGRQRPLDLNRDFARDGHRVVYRTPRIARQIADLSELRERRAQHSHCIRLSVGGQSLRARPLTSSPIFAGSGPPSTC
jgi:hypothetical protein